MVFKNLNYKMDQRELQNNKQIHYNELKKQKLEINFLDKLLEVP